MPPLDSSTLNIRKDDRAGTLTLRLEGTFDRSTALQLQRSLQELPDQNVVVDFSGVRRFQDTAVAVLSSNVESSRLTLAGLDAHHERLFRYFGLATERTSARERGYYTPEDLFAL